MILDINNGITYSITFGAARQFENSTYGTEFQRFMTP